jgi:hypothetical protein
MKQLSHNDPRTQPAPANQYREIRSVRLSAHRYSQLQAEVEDVAISRQDVIDVALDEYFARRYQAESK